MWLRYNLDVQSPKAIKSVEQQVKQQSELEANYRAKESREPLPYPGVWDKIDSTKLAEGATAEEIALRYQAFCKLCPPPQKIKYTI